MNNTIKFTSGKNDDAGQDELTPIFQYIIIPNLLISPLEKPTTNIKVFATYSLKGKRMKLNGYSLRNGCCRHVECCCIDDDTFIDEYCCCSIFSYSLQVSDDNITWRTIHSVEEDHEIKRCTNRVHKFDKDEDFTFVRLVLDKPRPYCENCFALNRFEIYGSAIHDNGIYDINNDDDESVSIIGKIDQNHDN